MRIRPTVYEPIYFDVREKFFNEKLKAHNPHNLTIKNPEIWDAKNENTGEYWVIELFEGSRPITSRYLYRKWADHKNSVDFHMDDLVLQKMLTYIGIRAPEHTKNWDNLKATEKVKILLREFVLQNKESIPTADVINILGQGNDSEPFDEGLGSNQTAAKLVVQRFYENIAAGNYEGAWDLMSPQLQNRKPWEGNRQRFEEGYTNTRSVRGITVFNVVPNVPNVIECKVFYEDDVFLYFTKEMAALNTLTVKHLDFFVECINKMKAEFESRGLENFDQIELSKLFEPAASEYIWYKCKYDKNKLDELFNVTRKSYIVKRVYDCSCHLTSADWKISDINAMQTYSAR